MPTEAAIPTPPYVGSYLPRDLTPLLTELSGAGLELPAAERERLMQHGGHYAETLPIEFRPTAEYEQLFEQLLAAHSDRVALLTRVLAQRVLEAQPDPVLVSLARAGTPIGILLRRALAGEGVDAPHYTVSIVRGRGLDPHALSYLLQHHRPDKLIFVDGWTGKGAIQQELELALAAHERDRGVAIAARLAVLADPAHVTMLCSTRADELIPSACLNSTVSGLMSRTVVRPDLLGHDAFHGVRIYREFADYDVSRRFVDTISSRFNAVDDQLPAALAHATTLPHADGSGLREVQRVQREHGIDDVHRVKPGIGETTRVLLRRVPNAILVDPRHRERLAHVLMLAQERGVPVRERRSEIYACFGLIERHEP
ncbi:MAG: cysteine protease StiP family protein [Solirubrobacteraceae bacterium]